MDLMERLKRIDEHFQNITAEQFEENLEKAGIGQISPLAKFGMAMVTGPEAHYLIYASKLKIRTHNIDSDLQHYSLATASFCPSEVA